MKDQNRIKNQIKFRRTARVRGKVSGDSKCPRVAVFKSLKHLSVQAIDDATGRTLVSVYDKEVSAKRGPVSSGKAKTKQEKASEIGKLLAKKLIDQKINKAIFDKRHYKYHGLVKNIAEGVREGGIKM